MAVARERKREQGERSLRQPPPQQQGQRRPRVSSEGGRAHAQPPPLRLPNSMRNDISEYLRTTAGLRRQREQTAGGLTNARNDSDDDCDASLEPSAMSPSEQEFERWREAAWQRGPPRDSDDDDRSPAMGGDVGGVALGAEIELGDGDFDAALLTARRAIGAVLSDHLSPSAATIVGASAEGAAREAVFTPWCVRGVMRCLRRMRPHNPRVRARRRARPFIASPSISRRDLQRK